MYNYHNSLKIFSFLVLCALRAGALFLCVFCGKFGVYAILVWLILGGIMGRRRIATKIANTQPAASSQGPTARVTPINY